MTLDPRARSQPRTATRLAQITGFCPPHAVYAAIVAVAEYLGDEIDQDWTNGATRITFKDGSVLVFSGPSVSEEDKSDD
jgi:hypothetical protein